MTITRAVTMASLALCMAGTALQLTGCSSVPKPAEADGSARVPANDAARVHAMQERVSADRQLLTENNLLRAQVEVLQIKLNEMTSIVREALTLPPAPRPQASPAPLPPSPQSAATPELPPHTYSASPSGIVIRVFHPFAHTNFEPSKPVASALRAGVRGAEAIEVRGHTDSNVVNAADMRVAMDRAEKARTWLIRNGADASKIRTKHFPAGSFLADNRTPQGRSMNRRVEIDIRNQHVAGNGPVPLN